MKPPGLEPDELAELWIEVDALGLARRDFDVRLVAGLRDRDHILADQVK